MTSTCCDTGTARSLAPVARPRRTFPQVVMRALGLAKQRRDLAALAPHQLQDIGLSAEQARIEAARPLWDAPAHWRKLR